MSEIQLLEAEENVRSAQLNSDWSRLSNLLSTQLIYIHSNGYIDDYSSYIEKIQKKILEYQKIEIETKSLQIFNDFAIKTSIYRGVVLVLGDRKFLNSFITTVWSRSNDRWFLNLVQSTALE